MASPSRNETSQGNSPGNVGLWVPELPQPVGTFQPDLSESFQVISWAHEHFHASGGALSRCPQSSSKGSLLTWCALKVEAAHKESNQNHCAHYRAVHGVFERFPVALGPTQRICGFTAELGTATAAVKRDRHEENLKLTFRKLFAALQHCS